MASGRKNYFRHSFFARNDIKLRRLRDEVGVGFYFYYFSLLEQCGEASSENLEDSYEFHDSIIKSLWSVNLKKSVHVASVMHSTGLLFFEKREKTFYFRIDNFAKYLGRYTNKIETNTPNKRKEKEIKENKSKEKKKENSPPEISEIITHWNESKIIEHKISDKLISDVEKLRKRKKEFKASDILKAIDNYKFILSSNDYIWSHKWSLKEFLQRENAEKFYPGEFDVERFPTLSNQKVSTPEQDYIRLQEKEKFRKEIFGEC